MNVSQLQVILNYLLTQIETLNENLVQFLMTRDELAIGKYWVTQDNIYFFNPTLLKETDADVLLRSRRIPLPLKLGIRVILLYTE